MNTLMIATGGGLLALQALWLARKASMLPPNLAAALDVSWGRLMAVGERDGQGDPKAATQPAPMPAITARVEPVLLMPVVADGLFETTAPAEPVEVPVAKPRKRIVV